MVCRGRKYDTGNNKVVGAIGNREKLIRSTENRTMITTTMFLQSWSNYKAIWRASRLPYSTSDVLKCDKSVWLPSRCCLSMFLRYISSSVRCIFILIIVAVSRPHSVRSRSNLELEGQCLEEFFKLIVLCQSMTSASLIYPLDSVHDRSGSSIFSLSDPDNPTESLNRKQQACREASTFSKSIANELKYSNIWPYLRFPLNTA